MLAAAAALLVPLALVALAARDLWAAYRAVPSSRNSLCETGAAP